MKGVYIRTNPPWNKGKSMSPESCKKMSESHKGMKKPWVKGAQIGHGVTNEWRNKMSENNKMRIEKGMHNLVGKKGVNSPAWKGGISTQEHKAGRPKPEICEVCGGAGRICFDHDHATGKFRGWICSHCNVTLGFARDNVEVLQKLIEYLNFHRMFTTQDKSTLSVLKVNN